jgi:antitoxin YqcF
MRQPDPYELALGRHVRARLGGATRVVRYGDDYGEHDMFLVSGVDFPDAGITCFGTVGLSKHEQAFGDKTVRVELVGACASTTPHFDNVMSSCVFEHLRNGTPIVYGSVIENILDQYDMSRTLRHVTFVAPFLFDGFDPAKIEAVEVHWLMAVAISDDELALLRSQGIDVLEDRFEAAQIDVYDINRSSVS